MHLYRNVPSSLLAPHVSIAAPYLVEQISKGYNDQEATASAVVFYTFTL